MDLGWGEILLVGFVALLVYGGRLPEVARSVGRSVASLKRGLRETTEGVTRELDPGIDEALRDVPRRTVRAAAPAPRDLATEDVSGVAAEPADARAPDPGTPPAGRA